MTPILDEEAASWHTVEAEAAVQLAASSRQEGLTEEQVAESRARHGTNELREAGAKSPVGILFQQFASTLVLILVAAAALSLGLGKLLEAVAIFAIVFLFALLGFFQEYRAEKAIAALRRLSTPQVRVVRNGVGTEVSSDELVVGDIVLLEAGVVVSADLRLLEAFNLRIQEAALTGESEPVDKSVEPLEKSDVPLGDRRNMAYMGTSVTYGRGVGLVTAVGMDTELGRIAELLQSVDKEQTPLQRRLDKVGRGLAGFGAGVALLVAAIGLLGGETVENVLLTAISTMVAVVPEGLPAVVTLTLALGAQRMLRRNALIRRLPAVETLGGVTVICTDKTGTLTENRMTVVAVDVAGHRVKIDEVVKSGHVVPDQFGIPIGRSEYPEDRWGVRLALLAGALCNDAVITQRPEDGSLTTLGDPTEASLLVAAARTGIDLERVNADFPRISEIPFDSERKRMTTVHVANGSRSLPLDTPQVAFVKGAVDGLVERSNRVWVNGTPDPMTSELEQRILAANEALAADGMRVLGVAMRPLSEDGQIDDLETELIFLGLIGIIDPPRAEVAVAVQKCLQAGIRPVMITGDHPTTALAIARQLGMPAESAVTGNQVEALDQKALVEAAQSTSVFARVSPEHKLRIVEALQSRGQVVAMTGDGVNDAPALRQADIGVAMGITGTDVSKEAADMVLRDDNFASIVAAVEEGRVIYDNLRRFVSFAVAGNIGKVLVMVAWPLLLIAAGFALDEPVALLPLQLLWLNLMTDGLLGLSLGAEPAEPDTMGRPPIEPAAGIFSGGLGGHTVFIGVVIGALTLAVGAWYHAFGPEGSWQTMMFTTLAVLQVFQALGVRSHRATLLSSSLFGNRALNAMVLVVLALQVTAAYLPGLSDAVLELESLRAQDWAVAVSAGVALVIASELKKALQRPANKGAG